MALLRVARLASAVPPHLPRRAVAGELLYHGESVSAGFVVCARRRCLRWPEAAVWAVHLSAVALTVAVLVQRDIHEAVELIIAALP
jgi:hypothetical protein